MPTALVLAAVGDNAPQAVVERVRAEMGLDQPLYVQFGHYLNQLLRGNFGRSILTSNPVLSDIAPFFPATMELATAAIILAALDWHSAGRLGCCPPAFIHGLIGLFA